VDDAPRLRPVAGPPQGAGLYLTYEYLRTYCTITARLNLNEIVPHPKQ
jgi:hypothetical protein